MKNKIGYLFVILFWLTISNLLGQTNTQDTLQIPAIELEEFFQALDTLEIQDSLKANLITELEHTIKLYELLIEQDSLVIMYKNEEIILLNEQIELHLDYLKYKDKWYNKPSVNIAVGVLGTVLLIQTLDYTLPD
tara:strand:+ start:352 stop:756 length:405 start_codon:yes stop_codon:yes gene_type:complete